MPAIKEKAGRDGGRLRARPPNGCRIGKGRFALTKRIQQLLDAEAAATRDSILILNGLGNGAADAFEISAELFESLSTILSMGARDRELLFDADRAAKKKLHSPKEVERANRYLLDPTTAANGRAKTAVRCRLIVNAWWATKLAFSLAIRHFDRGATDLRRLRRRLRASAALGNLRQQLEAVTLIDVFTQRPRLGADWLTPKGSDEARKTFWKLQPHVLKALVRYDLKVAYEWGSGLGMHPSMQSAAAGMNAIATLDALQIPVSDQEFDPERPFQFHLAV
jgi:hypothetical protein